MVREVAEEVILISALNSVESILIWYPILGGGDGAVQETSTLLIPFCRAVRLVGTEPAQ